MTPEQLSELQQRLDTLRAYRAAEENSPDRSERYIDDLDDSIKAVERQIPKDIQL